MARNVRSSTLVSLGLFGLLSYACAGGGSGGGPTSTGGATGSGGVTSTGGTTGKGGAVGSGGSSQKGGSTGTGGIVSTGGVPGTGGIKTTGTGGTGNSCVGCKVSISETCQSAPSTQTVRLSLDVSDGSLNALPLNTVTFRYWFTLGETTDPPVLGIDYAQVGSTALTSQFVAVSPPVTGANEYLEIGFTDAAPTLTGFGDSGPINLQIHGMGYSTSFDVDQTADYSFLPCGDASTTSLVPTQTITGYINGALAWGHEPS